METATPALAMTIIPIATQGDTALLSRWPPNRRMMEEADGLAYLLFELACRESLKNPRRDLPSMKLF